MALVEDLSGRIHNSCVIQRKVVFARGRGTYTDANQEEIDIKLWGNEIGEIIVKLGQNLK